MTTWGKEPPRSMYAVTATGLRLVAAGTATEEAAARASIAAPDDLFALFAGAPMPPNLRACYWRGARLVVALCPACKGAPRRRATCATCRGLGMVDAKGDRDAPL